MKKTILYLFFLSCISVNSASGNALPSTDEVAPEEKNIYTPGTYRGTSNGKAGDVIVEVTVSENDIIAIKVLKHNDLPKKMNLAKSGVIKNILEEQTVEVDVVAEASLSSRGIMQATENALKNARKNAE